METQEVTLYFDSLGLISMLNGSLEGYSEVQYYTNQDFIQNCEFLTFEGSTIGLLTS